MDRTFRLVILSAAVAVLVSPGSPRQARADFVGDLELLPIGCEASGSCKLGRDFGFVDAKGIGWQAAKGLITDGASIPPWAQPFIGDQFEKAFIKAAVIHDHYCDRHVRPWRQTHKVFYETLLKSGVSRGKAGIMYYAVMVGGPKWAKLIKGKPCSAGVSCINTLNLSASMPGSTIAVGEETVLFVSRPDEFGSARFANAMAAKLTELEQGGDALTSEQVEEMATEVMKNDFYFRAEDEIGTSLTLTTGNADQ
jgi:hypothetical protein